MGLAGHRIIVERLGLPDAEHHELPELPVLGLGEPEGPELLEAYSSHPSSSSRRQVD